MALAADLPARDEAACASAQEQAAFAFGLPGAGQLLPGVEKLLPSMSSQPAWLAAPAKHASAPPIITA